MQIEIKDRLADVRNNYENLVAFVKQEIQGNEFFKLICEEIKGCENDILRAMGEYMYNILYPISYVTLTQDPNVIGSLTGTAAVGKWFGQIVHSNISYYSTPYTFNHLSEQHVALTPAKKRNIVRDFYNFKLECLQLDNPINKGFYIINVPTSIYQTSRITAYNNRNNPSYVDLVSEHPIIVNNLKLTYRLHPFIINILINGESATNAEFRFQENYKLEEGKIDSNTLAGICFPATYNYTYVCLENPNKFLTETVKNDIMNVIKKTKALQDKWTALKMKYAHLLLQKGKI